MNTILLEKQLELTKIRFRKLTRVIKKASISCQNTIKGIKRKTDLIRQFDDEKFRAFIDKPYLVRPLKQGQYEIVVPSFIGFSAGWPVRHTEQYSVFIVTRFTNLMKPLPKWLADEIGFKDSEFTAVLDGNILKIKSGDTNKLYEKLGGAKTIAKRVGRRLFIKPSYKFDLLRRIIREEGFLPFDPQPIPKNLLWKNPTANINHRKGKPTFVLRNYQRPDFEQLKKLGAISVLAYPQTGKSYVALMACAAMKGEKIIFVPSRNLVVQWRMRLEYYLKPEIAAQVTVTTYNSAKKYLKNKYSLAVFDEAHRLPANFAIATSTKIKTVARLGLSATPFREDGQEDLIPALCGFPCGADWPVSDLAKPTIRVWIVKNLNSKYSLVKTLLQKEKTPGKTLVFTRLLNIGERVARQNSIPFVSGKTKDALDILNNHDTVVISSVGNEGLSFNVTRVIEIDFLYGSRMEFGQRLGRLGYTDGKKKAGVYNVIMTPLEYKKYGKRLLVAEQWGLDVEVRGAK